MFAGAYRFAGDPAEIVAAYDPMMTGVDPATLDLHVGADGLVVVDACPSEAMFRGFAANPEFAAARRRAGLLEPTIKYLGVVHQALLRTVVTR